jgi:hypothetical protein
VIAPLFRGDEELNVEKLGTGTGISAHAKMFFFFQNKIIFLL